MELLVIDVPEDFIGVVTQQVGHEKGQDAEDAEQRLTAG